MHLMLLTGMPEMDAERAFAREARARRRAALVRRLRRVPAACARLSVYDERSLPRAGRRAVREIPLDAITGLVGGALICALLMLVLRRAATWAAVQLTRTPLRPLISARTGPEGRAAERTGRHASTR